MALPLLPQLFSLQPPEKYLLHEQTLWLSSEKCIYWQDQKALIVSDLHFGKTGHFRKSGIAVPQSVYKEDLQRLFSQIQYFRPTQLIIVGDLFHSVANKEVDYFLKWRRDVASLRLLLVKGNHDILKKDWYEHADITVTTGHLSLDRFCFVHDIKDACEPSENTSYFFSGHIHPCIELNGGGRQSLKFPCFYFNKKFAILPAFGKFTGCAMIDRVSADDVFAILPSNPARGEHGKIVKV